MVKSGSVAIVRLAGVFSRIDSNRHWTIRIGWGGPVESWRLTGRREIRAAKTDLGENRIVEASRAFEV
jgi:hypothetical protein